MKNLSIILVVRNLLLIAVLVALGSGCAPASKEQESSEPAQVPAPVTESTESAEVPAPVTEEKEISAETPESLMTTQVTSVTEGITPALTLQNVYFDFDSFVLTPTAQEKLRQVAQSLRNNPSVRLQIEGHADERGTKEYNLTLGEQRAQVVKDFLIAEGVDPAMLSAISYGEEEPAMVGSNQQAWLQNRRVEFKKL